MFENDDFDTLLARLRVDKSPAGRGVMSYEDGGPVEEGGGLTDAQLDELEGRQGPVVAGQPSEGAGLTDEQLDQLASQHEGPEAEGALATGAREAAHGAVPAAVGLATAGAGAELGAIAGAPFAPFTAGLSIPAGAIVGGVVGGLGGGYAASKAQEAVLDATGVNDTEQRQANAQAHPEAAFVGGMAPAIATLKPSFSSAKVVERVLQGGIMGGLETAQQAASGEGFDPTHIAEAAAVGAAFPKFNAAGERLFNAGGNAGRWRPGRPDTQGRPEEAQAKSDAGQSQTPNVSRGASTVQSPPNEDTPSTGNPGSAPARSAREYPKENASNPDDTGKDVTKGYMAPDVKSALDALGGGEENAPQNISAGSEQSAPAPAAPPVAAQPENFSPPQPARVDENPVTDAFRAAGKPVPGEAPRTAGDDIEERAESGPSATVEEMDKANANASPEDIAQDYYVSVGRDNHAAALKAIESDYDPEEFAADKNLRAARDLIASHIKIDAAASETHTQPSDKQIEAENFKKGHVAGADVGLPGYRISTETERGGVRSSKPGAKEPWEVEDFPYHYGHILGTTGADGDLMDIAIDNTGKKKFIVDQLDAETGKFDEHKIFANTSDEARVRELYNKGFSDGKGPDRLGAISEVDTDKLKDFLKNGDETKPFDPRAGATEIKPTSKVDRVIQQLKDRGEPAAVEMAERLAKLTGDEQLAAAEKIRKAIFVKRPTLEGTNIQVRSGPDGERKGAALKAYKDAFEQYDMPSKSVPQAAGDIAALRERVTAAVTQANNEVSKIDWEGKRPYLPNDKAVSPGAMWLRAAKDLLSKKNITPAQAAKFHATELALRAGTPEDLANERDARKIAGSIAKSRRNGDTAVGNAEAAAAREAPFEVPGEEAERDTPPVEIKSKSDLPQEGTRELDISNPADAAEAAKILNSDMPQWKREQAARDAADLAKTERLKAARLAAKGEEKRDLASADHEEENTRPKNLVEKFRANESGAVNLDKVLDDATKALRAAVSMDAKNTGKDRAAQLLGSAADMAKTREKEPTRFFARNASTPEEAYARSVGDDLFKLHQADVQHKEDLKQVVRAAPKEADDEALFHARDSGDFSKLTPEQQKMYDDHVKPLLDQSDKLYDAIERLDPTRLGPKVQNHIYRIAMGHTGGDKIAQTNLSADPIEGRVSAIGTRPTGTGLERQFYALERQDGKRFVISTNNDGFTIWDKYNGTRVKAPDFEFADGENYKVGPNTFKMTQSTVKEIEANGRFESGRIAQYYHSPLLSASLANAELGAIARHLSYLEGLKTEIKQKGLGSPGYTNNDGQWVHAPSKAPDGTPRVETALKNFEGWKLHPQMAYALDDYAQPGFGSPALEQLSNAVRTATKSIFLIPVAHVNNVGAHWFVGRGWDNIKPAGLRSLVVDGTRAIRDVLEQGPVQKEIRDNGGSTLYGGVLNKDFIENMAKDLGHRIEKDPERYGAMIKNLGLNKAGDLTKWLYDSSSKAMWMANDAFITQRYLELRRKGMSPTGAINDLQKHIPSYRLPTQVVKAGPMGRIASQGMQASLPFVFGRYHHAIWNSYANMVKDIVGKEDGGAHRMDAIGQLMATGALLFMYAYPLKKLAETVTGNKDAEFHPRGPATIPMAISEARRTGDIASVMSPSLTFNPMFQNAAETVKNKDFSGKDIVEPGTFAKALKGSPSAAVKAVGQEAEHFARGVVAPYNTAASAYGAGRSPGAVVRDQIMDIKNPSPKATKWINTSPARLQRNEVQRNRKPHGPLEGLLDKLLK